MAKATRKIANRNAIGSAELEPDEREKQAVEAAARRIGARPPPFSIKSRVKDGVLVIASPDGDDAGFRIRQMDAFGTASQDFADHNFDRLGAAMRRRANEFPDQGTFNAALAAVDGMRPSDEVEAMLAVQMVATHETALEMLIRAKDAEYMPQMQESGALAVKLMRTFTAQVEALARLRRGGEQRVTVQHVTVNEGGQAVVGNVTAGGRGKK